MLLKRLLERVNAISPQVLETEIGAKPFAFDVTRVVEVFPIKAVSAVQGADEFLRGVINVRGLLVPIVDVGQRLGSSRVVIDANTKAVIVDFQTFMVGILTSKVVLRLRQTGEATVKTKWEGPGMEFLMAVLDFHGFDLPVLQIEKLLTDTEKQLLENLKKTF